MIQKCFFFIRIVNSNSLTITVFFRKDTEEKAKKKRGDENVYDAVNMDDKASGSRSSHELESVR